jgi:hypothetical protein
MSYFRPELKSNAGRIKLVAGRFKSGAYYSWLKTTPTILIHHMEFINSLPIPAWERHLAAIFEYFESVFDPPQRLADKSATKIGGTLGACPPQAD